MREMKLSRIRYIGKVPLDWQVRRVKTLTICLDGARIPVDATKRIDGEYPYWGAGNIVGYVNDYIFDDTIVLLGEDGAPFYDDSRPVAFLSTGKVWVNNHIHVLKNRESIIPGYLTYALNSVDYHGYLSGSIFPKLTQSSMNEIYLAVPSVEEQHTIVSFLDANGKLTKESYTDFTKKRILGKYPSLNDFLQKWTEAERKEVIVKELKEYDVLIDAIREQNPALAEADIFDVICHVAFDQKPMTRKERANKVKKSDYFTQYGEQARKVLEILLDKYADTGILELENIAILLTPQLAQFGKPQKIMKYFGGMDGYLSAVKNMESRLYAA